MHIRYKMILTGLILIAPAVIWNTASQVSRSEEDRADVIGAQRNTARHVADACSAWVRSATDLERTISPMIFDPYGRPKDDASENLARMADINPVIRHLAASDVSGTIFASDLRRLIGKDFSRYSFVKKVMGGADWSVSDLLSAELDTKSAFCVAAGIKNARGKRHGILIALMDEDSLRMMLYHDIAHAGRVMIIDSQSIPVLTCGFPGLAEDWSKSHFSKQGYNAAVEDFNISGNEMIGAVEPVKEMGWTAIVFAPKDKIIGSMRRQIVISVLSLSLIVGAMIGLAIFMGNRFTKPIVDLVNTARTFGQGNLDARAEVHTRDELESLGAGFNEMAAALQERTSQLNADLELERHQAGRASVLYTIAQGLVVTMSLNERLEVIARALTSICKFKRCVIFLRRGDSLMGTAGWGMMHPESIAGVAFEIGTPAGSAAEAFRNGSPIIVQDITNDPRIGTEFAKILAGFSVKGFLALPLVRKHHLVGLAALDNPGESVSCDSESIEAARGLATLAAIAIENAQVFEKERNVAQALQGSLLPVVPVSMGRFKFASAYYPALEAAELGGDFYDMNPLPDGRLGLVIADVSGKGLEAAIFTAMGKYTLRAFISEDPSPGTVLTRANNALIQAGGDWGFVTMFYGLLDPISGRLVYSNAGHPPSIVVRADGRTHILTSPEVQLPLGVSAGVRYVHHEYQFSKEDVLVCYTDGAIEARRNHEQFEIDRLAQVAAGSRQASPKEITEAIYKAVVDFSRGRIQDDIAMLVLKYE